MKEETSFNIRLETVLQSRCLGQLSNVIRSSDHLVTDGCGQVNAFIVGVTSTLSLESESDARAIT